MNAVTDQPFLSLVMPVHNGAEWIGATLDSLVSEQTPDIEIIIIDSSPDDATAAVIERYSDRLQFRLERRPELGPWQVKTNLGVEFSTAEYVCILHQDDLWLPGRARAVRRWIDCAKGAVLHLAPTLMIDREARSVGRWNCPLPAEEPLEREFLLKRLLVQNFICLPAPVFARSAWLQCGGMDETLWYTPDWDIWVKLSATGPVIYHDEITTAFRVHGGSLTMTGSCDPQQFRDQMQVVVDRYLETIPASSRRMIDRAARVSINVNVSLAAAADGSPNALFAAAANILSLGPAGMKRYLRDSRLRERVMPRLKACLAGSF